jgi:hypothetical protein
VPHQFLALPPYSCGLSHQRRRVLTFSVGVKEGASRPQEGYFSRRNIEIWVHELFANKRLFLAGGVVAKRKMTTKELLGMSF